MSRRVAILGTGLIGGSIGLALRSSGDVAVVGYDVDASTAARALERGALTAQAETPGAAASEAAVVFLAMPVDRIPEVCRGLAEVVEAGTVVSDVGSSKVAVVREAQRAFGGSFVGGHPMAGSERHGIDAADPELFRDAWWILTPTSDTSSAAYSAVTELVARMGAKPVALDPLVHDALVARLSHVPQIAASALVDVAATAGDRDALLELAGGGFRDATRIAASDPGLWRAIIRSNRDAVLDGLEGLSDRLARVAGMVAQGHWDELEGFLERARKARLELFAKPVYTGEPVSLALMVPDRPGVLAEVTTAAGELGANIEDLRIIHSTEGGRGRLELVIAGVDKAEALVAVLDGLGYHVERSEVVE